MWAFAAFASPAAAMPESASILIVMVDPLPSGAFNHTSDVAARISISFAVTKNSRLADSQSLTTGSENGQTGIAESGMVAHMKTAHATTGTMTTTLPSHDICYRALSARDARFD